jgi:hypothetical protein
MTVWTIAEKNALGVWIWRKSQRVDKHCLWDWPLWETTDYSVIAARFIDSSDERVEVWDSVSCYKKCAGRTTELKHGIVISMDLSEGILQAPSTSLCSTPPAGSLVIRTGHRQLSLGEFPKFTWICFWVLCFYVKFICDSSDCQSPTALLF